MFEFTLVLICICLSIQSVVLFYFLVRVFILIVGKTQHVSNIAGLVVGAIMCVLAFSIGYVIYKRRNRNKNVEGRVIIMEI